MSEVKKSEHLKRETREFGFPKSSSERLASSCSFEIQQNHQSSIQQPPNPIDGGLAKMEYLPVILDFICSSQTCVDWTASRLVFNSILKEKK